MVPQVEGKKGYYIAEGKRDCDAGYTAHLAHSEPK